MNTIEERVTSSSSIDQDFFSSDADDTISSSILTLSESVSEDFESKNGVRGSELTLFSSGWVIVSETKD